MTTSDYRKMLKQLKAKPVILKRYMRFNTPKKRSCGFNIKRCRRCGRTQAHIGSYELHFCRQCFREIASKIGFKKYS